MRSHCRIGQDLYNAVMPIVTQQVASQIRVRDFSATKVAISPSEHTSWSDARNELVSEAKSAMRAELETSLSAASGEGEIEKLRKDFATKEALIEHSIDSEMHTFSMQMKVTYNVRSAASNPLPPLAGLTDATASLFAVPLQVNWKSLRCAPPPLLLGAPCVG